MAEFKEVIKQYKRMCKSYKDCDNCPFKTELGWDCEPAALIEEEDMDIWETTVMEWARTHPEPKYPTIGDMLYFIANEMNVSILTPKDGNFSNFLNSELPEKVSNRLIRWLINKGEK